MSQVAYYQRSPKSPGGGGAHKLALGFIACVLAASTVAVSAPQADAAPIPNTLTVTVNKHATQSVQSIIAVPIDFDNAAGYGTIVKVSTTASDLTPHQAALSAPSILADNTFGFALEANPTGTSANLVPNGFSGNYTHVDSVAGLSHTFAGLSSTAITVLHNEVTGQNTANLYFSAKAASSLAAGDYHVSINIETISTTATSLTGTIAWSDDNNSEGIRPNTVGISLYKSVGGAAATPVAATPRLSDTTTDTWTYSFDNLPEYESGQAVTYTAQAATPLPLGYTAAKTGDNFTYSHALGSGILRAETPGFLIKFLNTNINRSVIKGIIFQDTTPTADALTDVSAAGDGSVMASWDSVTSTLTIGATGGVYANMNSYALFDGLAALTALNLDNLHAERATNMQSMFQSATLPAGLSFPVGFGSQATNMSSMFCYADISAGLSLPDGFGSEATDMIYMFQQATLPVNLSFPDGFGSAAAVDMSSMFSGTSLPTGFSLPANFGSQATSMASMFFGATLPAAFSFSALTDFGSEATNMNSMFRNSDLPTGLGFPDGFGSAATDMNSMFQDTIKPIDLAFPAGFGSAAAATMGSMFWGTTLTAGCTFSTDFGSQATDMNYMFRYATLEAGFSLPADFGTQAANMANMFSGAKLLAAFSFSALTGFGSQATTMSYMFNGATLPVGLTFPANFGTAATTMSYMFNGATLQGNLDWSLTTFTTAQLAVLNVQNMFYNTNFGSGYTIKVADTDVQTKFTEATTRATTTNIVV